MLTHQDVCLLPFSMYALHPSAGHARVAYDPVRTRSLQMGSTSQPIWASLQMILASKPQRWPAGNDNCRLAALAARAGQTRFQAHRGAPARSREVSAQTSQRTPVGWPPRRAGRRCICRCGRPGSTARPLCAAPPLRGRPSCRGYGRGGCGRAPTGSRIRPWRCRARSLGRRGPPRNSSCYPAVLGLWSRRAPRTTGDIFGTERERTRQPSSSTRTCSAPSVSSRVCVDLPGDSRRQSMHHRDAGAAVVVRPNCCGIV